MQKIIIDSSIWLSLILIDSNYTKSLLILKNISNKTIICIPDILILELITVFKRHNISNSKIKNFINNLSYNYKTQVLITNYQEIFKYIYNTSTQITSKTHDLIIITHAILNNIDLFFTLDKNQLKQYQSLRNEKN